MSDLIDWVLEDEKGHVIDKSEERKRKEDEEYERLMDDYYDDWPWLDDDPPSYSSMEEEAYYLAIESEYKGDDPTPEEIENDRIDELMKDITDGL